MIIVGICGASGSGKSTLAKRIKDSLACSCAIIGQDCYYRSFPELPLRERMLINYDEPNIFNYEEIIADLKAFQAGKPITKKGYDYANHLRADTDELIDPPEVLIMEGIHMFHDERLCRMMSLKVYMHVDIDICLIRRIKRDIKMRGRSIDNISVQYIETVKPMYEKYIANYINDADFAIMRGGKNKMAIDAISAYLTTKVLAERFENERKAMEAMDSPEEPDSLIDDED
ncbi:MAG: uridine kinase [Clostridia bacterium]|nr:uridine kinase [Clostridia bacterium]